MELSRVDDAATLKKVRSQVLRLLTYRARSGREVHAYLERKGYGDELIKSVIAEMVSYGYINDSRFASDFINQRKQSGYGLKKIRYELLAKGIEREIIDAAIADQFNPEEESARIRAILEKRSPVSGETDSRWVNRQAAYLKRRGFQDNLIINILKKYNDYYYFD
jgi:regulatory protein